MHLAYFLEYPLAGRGGVSVLVETLIEHLPKSLTVTLISPDSAETMNRHPLRSRLAGHISWQGRNQPPGKAFAEQSNNLLEAVSAAKIDLGHFHCGGLFGWGNRWPGCALPVRLRQKKIRSVWTNHLVVDLLHGFCGPEKPLLYKTGLLPFSWIGKAQQLAAVDAEICVSRHDAAKVRGWYAPFQSKVVQIYHSRLPEQLPGPPSPDFRSPHILSVGHVAFRKGQHILAEAFAQIANAYPEWSLLIAGEIVEEACAEKIREIARRHRLESRIRLLGTITDPLPLMASCGIFVQPSLQEALGLALQEALTAGCACIGSCVGGIPELIDSGENGLLIPAGNVQDLAMALVELISDGPKRSRFSSQAGPSIRHKKMTLESMVQAHLELYQRIFP